MLPLLLCLSAVTLDATAAVNILALFPHPGKSHFMVFEPLVHELARRGHNLTVLSFFPSPTPRSNYRDISLEGLVEAHVATVNMTNFEPLYGLERVLHHYTDMSRLARYAVEVCERLMSWPAAQELLEGRGHYDVILVETFNSDCVLGAAAAAYRAPVVGISAQQLLPWVADRMGVPLNAAHMPLLILPLGGRMSVLERLENAFFTQFYKVWFRWQVQVKEQAILERRLGAAAPDLATVVAQTSMILANTHHCLNGVWPLPPGVIEVGGLHLTPSEEVIPAALERVLAAAGAPARPGVVLVSFGSLLNGSTMPAPRVHAMLAAFARLPHTFVWKWEADVPPAGPDNVFFYKWIPQQMLLSVMRGEAFLKLHGYIELDRKHAQVLLPLRPSLIIERD